MKDLIKDAELKRSRKFRNRSKAATTAPGFETGLIRSRAIPPAVVAHFAAKIESLEPHVEEVLQAEEVARMDRLADMEANKAQNIIEYADEIHARPRREWFASKKEKTLTKQTALEKKKMIEEKAGTGTHRMTRKKRRAREALQALKAAQNENDSDDEGENDGSDKHHKMTPVSVKTAARRKKKVDGANERHAAEKSGGVFEIQGHERASTVKMENKNRKASGMEAVGDGCLFDEERVSYALSAKKGQKQREEVVAKGAYKFRGHDPLKKLGKKRGAKAFKSRSKYKRKK